MITVHIVPVLKDNYSYVLQAENGDIAVVDPGEAAPVIALLEEHKLKPSIIFNTHHHGDHIAGNAEIKQTYGTKTIASAKENRITSDIGVEEGSDLSFGGEKVRVLETPGHTRGHICFYFEKSEILFTGDTLFSLGCGRLFEGTPEIMWNSLEKIIALPDEAHIYCGHEYTLENGKFCMRVEPDNADLQRRMLEAAQLRDNNKPTLPVSLALEKKTNVFLRAGSASRFGELRKMRDDF